MAMMKMSSLTLGLATCWVLCMVLGYTHNISTVKRAMDVSAVPFGYSHTYASIHNSPGSLISAWRDNSFILLEVCTTDKSYTHHWNDNKTNSSKYKVYQSSSALLGAYFVIDGELPRNLHSTNFDQLYAYLRQHEALANEMRIFSQQLVSPHASQRLYDVPMVQQRSYQTLVANYSSVVHHQSYQALDVHQASFHTMDSGVVVRQRLFGATTVKRKAIWQDSVPNLKGLGIQHDNRDTVITGQQSQEIPTLAAFQTDDLDAFDSDYIGITSDSNMISYEQYLKETKNTIVQDTFSPAQQEAMIMSVIEEINTQVAKFNEVDKENRIINESLTTEIERYKEQINLFVERQKFDLNDREKYIDSQLRKAFWLPISKANSETPPVKPEPVLKEIPRELPTISLIKDSFNKMRSHVNDFENVVIVRTKVTGHNEGLTKEMNDMKEVFNQMETVVAKCSVERKTFEIKEKELLIENDRLLELIISQDLVYTAVNTLAAIADYQKMEQSYMDEYNEYLELKTELLKKNDMVDKAVYNELSKRCERLENRCISFEIKVQQYKKSFQNNQPRNKQNAPEFPAFFEINELKVLLKAKDNSISKLKDHIATLKGKSLGEYSFGDTCKKLAAILLTYAEYFTQTILSEVEYPTYPCLRKKYRLSLKNDIPPRDK
ncbi:hypothetical protein Tco_1549637 [Tanacetum coccineum]